MSLSVYIVYKMSLFIYVCTCIKCLSLSTCVHALSFCLYLCLNVSVSLGEREREREREREHRQNEIVFIKFNCVYWHCDFQLNTHINIPSVHFSYKYNMNICFYIAWICWCNTNTYHDHNAQLCSKYWIMGCKLHTSLHPGMHFLIDSFIKLQLVVVVVIL